jgi:hypothetical protein
MKNEPRWIHVRIEDDPHPDDQVATCNGRNLRVHSCPWSYYIDGDLQSDECESEDHAKKCAIHDALHWDT